MNDGLLDAFITRLADEVAARLDPKPDLPVTWSVKQVQQQTGLSRDAVTDLIARGEIRAIRLQPGVKSSRILVIPESVIAWRDRQAQEQDSASSPTTGSRGRERTVNPLTGD